MRNQDLLHCVTEPESNLLRESVSNLTFSIFSEKQALEYTEIAIVTFKLSTVYFPATNIYLHYNPNEQWTGESKVC